MAPMRPHLAIVGLIGLCAAAAACGSSTRRAPVTARPSATRSAPVLTCGAPPDSRPRLSRVASRTLALPGSPDGIATARGGQTSFVALQSGPARVAVVARQRVGTVALPGYPSGMRVAPDGRTALAAVGDGAVVLDAHRVLGMLSTPSRVAGSGPGAAEIAVSPDSRYAFITLEGAGRVAVFALRADRFVGSVPVGAGALGITTSPDGRWLYEVSEAGGPHGAGRLNVIDLIRAEQHPSTARVSQATVACAPVRVAVSPDGRTVWVTARDANSLLGFSAAGLRRDPGRALTSVTRVGARPLGLAVVAGQRVLVADSGDRCVSVVDAAISPPSDRGCIASGALPDAISAPPGAARALVTVSDSRELQVIALGGLP